MAKGVKIDFDASTGKARGELAKVHKELEKSKEQAKVMGREVSKMGKKLESAGRGGKRSIDGVGSALGGLGPKLLALAGPAMVFATISKYANRAKEEIKSVAQELSAAHAGMKNLWQVSESKEAYARLSAEMKMSMAREGIGRQAAGELAFNLKSLDRPGALGATAKTARFMDPAVAAKFYTTLSADLNYGRGVGTPEQVFSGLLAGASTSKFNTAETADWATRVAPTMKGIGASPAEFLGAGAAMSTAAANPEQLATFINAIAQMVDKEGFGGQGLLAGFQKLRADPAKYAKLKQSNAIFGRAARALEGGYDQALKNRGTIGQAFASEDLFESKTDLPRELSIQQEAEASEVQRSISLEPQARKQTQLRTMINRLKALAAFSGKSIAIEGAWEDALETGATYGQIDRALEAARQRYLENLHAWQPEVFEEHIPGTFPVDPGHLGLKRSPELKKKMMVHDVPRDLSPAQRDALSGAAERVAERGIEDRLDKLIQATDQGNVDRRGMMGPPELGPTAIGNQ